MVAERSVADAIDTESHRLKMTIPAILASHPGATLLAECALRHPEFEIRVDDQTSVGAVWDAVASGRSELGFVTTLEDPGMKAIMLGRHTLVAVFPPETEHTDEPMTIDELAVQPWIAGPPLGFHSRNAIQRSFARHGTTLRTHTQVAHRQLTGRLVLAGVGPAIMISEDAADLAKFGAVVRRTDPEWDRPYYVIHRRSPLSTAATAFIDIATDLCHRT